MSSKAEYWKLLWKMESDLEHLAEAVVEQFQTTRAEYVMVKAQSLRVSDENPNV